MRLQGEEGFGLIELVMSMVMLNIGILALVAAFNSGAVSLRRASHVSTASTIADTQMETYRALTYAQILFDSNQAPDNTWKCDAVLGSSCPNTVTFCSSSSCADGTVPNGTCGTANSCLPTRTITAATSPDHYPYRVDSYIVYKTPTQGRQLKQITVVVRDGNTTSRTYARETSTFDPAVSG